MVSLQSQSLSSIVVSITVALVVVSAWTVTVTGTPAGVGQAATDMVPFHRRRTMVGRPGRKGALWA